jgi:hypothetical protein
LDQTAAELASGPPQAAAGEIAVLPGEKRRSIFVKLLKIGEIHRLLIINELPDHIGIENAGRLHRCSELSGESGGDVFTGTCPKVYALYTRVRASRTSWRIF